MVVLLRFKFYVSGGRKFDRSQGIPLYFAIAKRDYRKKAKAAPHVHCQVTGGGLAMRRGKAQLEPLWLDWGLTNCRMHVLRR